MVVPAKRDVTRADFDAWVRQAENRDKRFEYLDGEIIEVPSNPYVSVIAARIITFLSLYLLQQQIAGYVTGEGGGFLVDDQVFAPDVAYVTHLPTRKGYELAPPLLAVEVISDPYNNVEQSDLRRKLAHYRRAGVLVWIVDYAAQQVEVHRADGMVQILSVTDTLTGDAILPGLTLPIADIFPKTE